MTVYTRINRIYAGLSAKERAIHILHVLKGEAEEDPHVRSTMPESQVVPFNRYIDLIRAANDVHPAIIWLAGRVDTLGALLGWLCTFYLWSARALELDLHLWKLWKEPIAEAEYAALIERRRNEYAPVSELAELLADRCSVGATPPDTDASWANEVAVRRRQLNDLVEGGVLPSRGKGSRLSINVGAFHDHLGEPTPFHPDWGSGFDVLPDSDTERIRLRREDGNRLRALVSQAPSIAFTPLEAPDQAHLRDNPTPDRIAAILAHRIKDGISSCWRQLQAIEAVVSEIAAKFDGEDPLVPAQRQAFSGAIEALIELRTGATKFVGDFDLGEPDEELIAQIRDSLELQPITGTKIAYVSLSDVVSPVPGGGVGGVEVWGSGAIE